MSKHEKLIAKILGGHADTNISFDELCNLLTRLGFEQRVKGSHHIFRKAGVIEIDQLATGRTEGESVSGKTGTGSAG